MVDNKKENNEERHDYENQSVSVKKTQTKKKTKRKTKAKTKTEENKQLDELPEILKEETDDKRIELRFRLFILLFIILVFVLVVFPFFLDDSDEKTVTETDKTTSTDNNIEKSDTKVVEDNAAENTVSEDTVSDEFIAVGKGWAIKEQEDGDLILNFSEEDLTDEPGADINLDKLRNKLTPHGWGVWSDAEGGIILVPGGASDIPAILKQSESVTPDVAELREQLTPHGWGVWPDGEGGVLLMPRMFDSKQ